MALGGHGAERLRVDATAARGAARRSSTASGSIISSACIAPTSARLDQAVKPFFAPPDEPTQLRSASVSSASIRRAARRSSPKIWAPCPTSSAESLQRLNVPGFKVLRWERDWTGAGQPFVDPLTYPETSVATTGTHDTEPLVAGGRQLPPTIATVSSPSRRSLDACRAMWPRGRDADVPGRSHRRGAAGAPRFDVAAHDLPRAGRLRLARSHQHAGACRRENWTWRLPWPVDRLAHQRSRHARRAPGAHGRRGRPSARVE